jgi:hypothetical protein
MAGSDSQHVCVEIVRTVFGVEGARTSFSPGKSGTPV